MTAFVTVEGRTLAAALKSINMVIERRNNIPILSYVRVRIEKGDPKLIITGTDLDMHMTVLVDVLDLGDADFDFCLPSGILEQIAAKAGPAPVKIRPCPADPKYKDKFNPDLALIDVADGDATYDVQSLPATDFPKFPTVKDWTPIETFTNGRFAALLDKVASCISSEETRYYLNGICWQIDTFGRHMTATDGHRLASARYADYVDEEPLSSTIIPRKAVEVMRKISKGKDVAIAGNWSEAIPAQDANLLGGYGAKEAVPPTIKYLRFQFGPVTLRTKVIDGTFPDWRRVVPKDNPHRIEFDADRLRTAIERVMPLSREHGRAIRIHRGENGKACVTIRNPDSGEGTAKAFADWPMKEEVFPNGIADSFGFNAHYLLAALGKAPGAFALRFADAGSPFLIETDDEELTRVLMPMRV